MRYGVAVLAAGLALVLQALLIPLFGGDPNNSPFLAFFAAVVVAAWFGGLGPGLLAVGLSALLSWYFFLTPQISLAFGSLGQALRLVVFAVEGVVISSLVGAMHTARARAEQNALRARENEQRLARSEENFRLLVEGAKDYAIFMLTPDGRVSSWNPGARRVLGYEEEEIFGENFSMLFTPEGRREGMPGRELERAKDEGEISSEYWAVRKDGSRIWANGSTSALRDEEGNLRGLVKVLRDRTEGRRAEDELRLKDRAIAASVNGVVITDPNQEDNPIVYVNPAFEDITGYTSEEVVGRNCRFLHGDDRDQPALDELRAAIGEGRAITVVLKNFRKDGTPFWNELSVSPVRDEEGRVSRFVGIQDDVTERIRSEEGLRVLAEASEVLTMPLDYRERLRGMARLTVPGLADWCAVDALEEDGSLSRLAVYHEDPQKVALAHELQERYPPDPDAPYGVHHVMRTGEPELMPEIPETLLDQVARDDRHRELIAELGLRSYIIVPMEARGRTLGTVTLVSAESRRRFDEKDLTLVETLVRRAALAVDNARLYEEARKEISERERAEEKLRRSEERYRAVIEQSAEGIYLLDTRDGRILETNPSLQRMLGYAAEELEGMTIYDLVDHPHEDVDSKMRSTVEEERLMIAERRYRRKDGTVVYVEIGASAISFNSHRAICAAVRDITERKRAEETLKRSEERFRYLVRYASDIIVVLDRDGSILFESPAVERVLGFTPEERIGTNAFEYLHPEDRGPVAERFARLAQDPGGRVSAEYRAQDREGGWRHFEAIGVNLLDDPVVRGIVVNSRDVTERKQAEDALAEIREAERNRIARELHDGVLQDLSYVAQALEVTRVRYEGTGVEDDLEEKAEAIRRAALELREAIYDLRVYGHEDLKGGQLLESLVELNRVRMPGCEIDLDVEEGFFDGLSERGGLELIRIVQEALTNVRRHSGARNVRVSLGSSGAAIRVEITDDGRGFDTGAVASGMGNLGMSERARALGGELEVHSEPGVGTTVRLEVLPDDLPD